MRRVAFQGERGAFSEEAIALLWRGEAEPLPRRTFGGVAAAVVSGEADQGLLPIENTLAGSVIGSYDALAAHPGLRVVAEVVLPVHHCLLALPGAALGDVRYVESHPVALAQCEAFLAKHPAIEVRAAYDTAGAARDISTRGDRSASAIAGHAAAQHYGLTILVENIEDRPDNQTRFLAVSREASVPARGVRARTTFLVTAPNTPGALLRILQPFADRSLNLSKLESRPTGEPWTYQFFLEVEHPGGDPVLDQAVDAVRGVATSVRVLGCYPRWMTPAEVPAL